jgi:hypothetical protein
MIIDMEIMTNNLIVATVCEAINRNEAEAIHPDDVRGYIANDRIVGFMMGDENLFEGIVLIYYSEGSVCLQFEYTDKREMDGDIWMKDGLDAIDGLVEEFGDVDYFLMPKDLFEVSLSQ